MASNRMNPSTSSMSTMSMFTTQNSRLLGSATADPKKGSVGAGSEGERKTDPTPVGGGGQARKSREKFTTDKMRIKLTPIEEYERKLVFHLAEAPGRVVSRLERLMGSDQVCLMEHDWMRKLEDKLDAEDEKEWVKRNDLRMKAESIRYRKLAIDGYMPVPDTPDMQDIYNNPIYRVNKIINRLNKFDYNAMINPKLKMPALNLVDPFENDDSGNTFKSWPGHAGTIEDLERIGGKPHLPHSEIPTSDPKPVDILHFDQNWESDLEPSTPTRSDTEQETPNAFNRASANEEMENSPAPAPVVDDSLEPEMEMEDDEEEIEEAPEEGVEAEEEQEELEKDEEPETLEEEEQPEIKEEELEEKMEENDIMGQIKAIDDASNDSLEKLRQQYGIPKEADLKMWEPFQSELLDMFDRLNDKSETAVDELYEMGDEVVGVYNREVLEAEEACIHLNKVIHAYANSMEIPVKPGASTAGNNEEEPEASASKQSMDASENVESESNEADKDKEPKTSEPRRSSAKEPKKSK